MNKRIKSKIIKSYTEQDTMEQIRELRKEVEHWRSSQQEAMGTAKQCEKLLEMKLDELSSLLSKLKI